MKIKHSLKPILLFFTFSAAGYSQVTTDTTTLNAVVHPNGYSTTVNLDSNKIYLLKGFLFIQSGGMLNIPSGTIIRGDKNSKGCLLINRGGKIYALGTATRPIVFTSNLPAGSRAAGDWGGMIIIGKATINTYTGSDTAIVEGILPDVYYGGHDDNDNSGIFQYVRIEYAGIALSANNEINGLSLYSVGKNTVIDHVMVSYSGDDGFEWFGGTVNLKYLIAFNDLDDDFDDSYGYRGKVQFCLGVRTPGIADASGSHCFESDNNEYVQGMSTVFNYNMPRTQSIFCNVTSIGAKEFDTSTISSNFSGAIRERRNTLRNCYNSVFMGWNRGYRFDQVGVANACIGDTIKFTSNIIAGISGNNWDTIGTGSTGFQPATWGMASQRLNDTLNQNVQVMLVNPYSQARLTSNFMPQTGSPVYNNTTDPTAIDPFFSAANYRGAFGGVDWGLGWQNWRPDTVNYNNPIGILPVSSIVPDNFSLYQNYPNPFNPATTIKFDIPSLIPPLKGARGMFVQLVIYDVLGRIIVSPVNENLQAGTYKILFDAPNLPSGAYFYKLTVNTQNGDWTESKKMMLIK